MIHNLKHQGIYIIKEHQEGRLNIISGFFIYCNQFAGRYTSLKIESFQDATVAHVKKEAVKLIGQAPKIYRCDPINIAPTIISAQKEHQDLFETVTPAPGNPLVKKNV